MAAVFKFETSAGVTLLDMNSTTGFALEVINLDDDAEEQTWLKQTPHPGGVLAATRTDIALVTATLILLPQASVAAMEALMATLHTELSRKYNILRWQPNGGTAVVYNTYKSPARPSLYRGQGGILPGTGRVYDPIPIPIVIPRDPVPRSGTHI